MLTELDMKNDEMRSDFYRQEFIEGCVGLEREDSIKVPKQFCATCVFSFDSHECNDCRDRMELYLVYNYYALDHFYEKYR
jgi:hypothetical protein